MPEDRKHSISEMVDDDTLITEALQQAVREELLSHARAGNAVPISEDGHVVWLSPQEIFRRLGYGSPPDAKAS